MRNKTRRTLISVISSILILIGIFLLLEGAYYSYNYVFEPAYVSVVSGCGIRSAESMGYVTAGTFTYNPSNKSQGKINIVIPSRYDDSWYERNRFMESDRYKRIMKHEVCHRRQHKNGVLGDCSRKLLLYLNEVSCYTKQYF